MHVYMHMYSVIALFINTSVCVESSVSFMNLVPGWLRRDAGRSLAVSAARESIETGLFVGFKSVLRNSGG